MTDQSRTQDQEAAAVANDPTLNKQAVDEAVKDYEESAKQDDTKKLDPIAEKELGNVERLLEDTVLGIEDAS